MDRVSAVRMAILVGSFDPIHRGHQSMVAALRQRFGRVLLLVPSMHFEKEVQPPHNATLAQRVEMIHLAEPPAPGSRVEARVSDEVLFVRLARLYPEAAFGMGQDTHAKLLQSARYFERLGLVWGDAEQQTLDQVLRRVVVFDRGADGISSTRVRGLCHTLHAAGAPTRIWQDRLGPLVTAPVISYIRKHGLYPGTGSVAPA